MLELTESLNGFQHRSPKLYIGVVIIVALLGLLTLALLPILSIKFFFASLTTLFTTTITQSQPFSAITAILYQAPLAGLFGYLTYQLITLPLDAPKASEIYVSVNKKKTPKLIALINEFEQRFNIETIDNIIITDHYDISIHTTPEYGLAHLGETSLLIGLPLMQTVSAKQFKALLIRRIGQLSKEAKSTTNRIYFFSDILEQYRRTCQQNAHWSIKPFYYFFKYYQMLFNAISFYAIRMNELKNDEFAVSLVDGKSFAQALSQTIIASHYLKNVFWMSMYKLQRQYPTKTIFPHANMTVSFTQSIVTSETDKLLNTQFQRLSDFQYPTPLLRARLKMLGHDTYSLPLPLENTAAIIYLDNALPRIAKIFDKLWLEKLHTQRDTTSPHNSHEQRLSTLTNKITKQALSAEETWELAVLTEKVKGYHAAVPIYKKIIERNPMHAKAMFAIGRILLSYNDANGINAIEKAAFLDASMRKTADELIARYQARVKGIKEEAEADKLFA